VVVIRYFGGTKLGVSGLINAYKETTKITLGNAKIEEHAIKEMYTIEFEYPLMNSVMQVLKNTAIEIKNTTYNNNNNVIITFEVMWTRKEEICGQLRNIYGVSQKYIMTV
jgi:putative IMPACT (imprinted ancient) family translation regulator